MISSIVVDKNTNVNFPKRNMLLLFLSRFVSDLGSAIFKFALSLYVLDITGSPAIYSLILTLSILPSILISIFAGSLIDKNDKKKIIFGADIISGIIVLGMFLLIEILGSNIAILGTCVVVVGVIQSFLNLGINSCLGNIVEKEKLPKANSFFQAMGAIIIIIGPVISALLYKQIGIKSIMFLDGISFIIGGILTALLVFISVNEDSVGKKETLIENFKYIFKYVKTTVGIEIFMVILGLLTFVYSPLTMVAIQSVMRIDIASSEYELSIVLAALGIGVILGALLAALVKDIKKILVKIPALILLLTIVILLWMLPVNINNICNSGQGFYSWTKWNTTILFSVILFLMGAIYTMMIIPMYSYLQANVAENVRGRVFGLALTVLNLAGVLGVVLYGQLLENFNVIVVIVVSAVALISCITITLYNKDFKRFKRQ